jgi:hypothetical protein
MMGVWFGSTGLSTFLAGQLAQVSTRMDTSRHYVELEKER